MKSSVKNRFSNLFQKRQQAFLVPHETTRAPSVTIPNTLSECFVSKLPKEVLLRVFDYLRQERRSSRSITTTRNRDLYHVSLVCRTWNNLAAHICYHTVQFYSVLSVLRFHQILQTSSHISKIVKTLIFPTRYGYACPNELLDAFQGITNRIESLSELNTTLRLVEEESSTEDGNERFHVLPIGEGHHNDLRHLSLYGNGNTPARFPAALSSFKRLSSLALKGVFLSEPVSTDVTPALPRLQDFTIEGGNVVLMMDDWLLSCPKLQRLFIIGPQPAAFSPSTDDPPMRLLVHGKITYWHLSGSGHTQIGRWLASCNSITCLLLDWTLFSNSSAGIFPPSLHQLSLDILPQDSVTLDAFDRHFGASPISHVLFIILCWERNASFEHSKEELKVLCAKSDVFLEILDRSGYTATV
ncbi:hypothetical protein FRC18_001277 [Serendipita sp. 400]|nr:hypothetical protein FRC18_001277 [Serendipita sp. 400]